MKLTAVKYANVLHVDPAGLAELETIPNGTAVTVEIKRPRNINHHKLFFALLSVVHDQVDHARWPTPENLLDTLKIAAGVTRPVLNLDGTITARPGSIAFASMDHVAFAAFFNRICDLVCRVIIPGMEPGVLKREISEMVGLNVEDHLHAGGA